MESQLERVVTFANGKGGAGKTSCAVSVAGLSAAAGWRTLLVDLDPQGNAGHDLGYAWDGQTDHGQGLVDALVAGQQLEPNLPEIRPKLAILGAVLFDTGTTATVVRRHAVEDIRAVLDGAAPVLEAVIRHSESAAVDAREKGMLVHELAETVNNAEPYWKALQQGRTPTRIPGSAPALAEDYVLLAQEVLTRIAQHEKAATA